MENQSGYGVAPPSYNEATAPSCPLIQQPQPQLQEPYLQSQLPYAPQQQPPYPPQQQPPYPIQQQPPYPSQQQQPYPIQQQPYPQSVVVTIPQTQCVIPFQCGKSPLSTNCTNCRNQIITNVSRETKEEDACTSENNTVFWILFILGFCTFFASWLFSCCPYICCVPTSTTYRHSCPRCNAVIGSYTEKNK